MIFVPAWMQDEYLEITRIRNKKKPTHTKKAVKSFKVHLLLGGNTYGSCMVRKNVSQLKRVTLVHGICKEVDGSAGILKEQDC